MHGADSSHVDFGVARVQVTGRTDYMDPGLLSLMNELPDDLRAAGFEPDLFFQEPGGRGGGLAPIEEVVLYLGPELASGVIGGAAWAAVTAVINWARKRIRREPSSHVIPTLAQASSQEPIAIYVNLRMYSGEGAFLSHIDITADGVEYHFMHPAIGQVETSPEETVSSDNDVATLYPNSGGNLAVITPSGAISCLIQPGWVACETPATNWPRHDDGTPFHSFKFHANGSVAWADGQIGDLPRVTLAAGSRYRAFDWTIVAVEDGLALINDQTGRGVRVTPDEVEAF